ncbi:rod shape-determining protein MreC [Tumebacillus permanentifrigoris]|uniref:Cell shape-determining protein MreC n=1 Tax=Tumebacillus permanentifrigoris TaxID=378543 RepID=A0A316D3M5_9BACL|nr:rod shape-determining protein MreC [Tumebacillus permanentifrigoris]PWK06264.1 rod shape-determining protein MreC [Tumebacillus permanentifrigoris]
MTRFFTSKRLMVLLASFILLAALVGLTLRERENPTWPEKMLIDAFGWMQGAVYAPVQHVAGFFEDMQHIKQLYEENAKLKANLNDYSSMRVRIQGLEQENKRLKEDLGLKSNSVSDLQLIAANVIGRSPSTWNSEVTLDVGTKDGVQKNMAVITANHGLVGRIYEVTPYHAKVLLITDKGKMGISAKVTSDELGYGILNGSSVDVSQTSKPMLEMSGIKLGAEKVKLGDSVVTSNVSDIFPPGLIIGKITSIENDKLGLTKIAQVEPAANLNNMDFLYVVNQAKTGQ